MVKISVIMPVFNDEDYLKESIESVDAQTFKDLELICVNDGSTDSSLDILNEFSLKHDFIKVYSQENNGSGSARNNGLNHATGEYIAFLDSDDLYVDKHALEIMYDVAVKNNADMVSANLVNVNPQREITNKNPNCENKYICFDEYCNIRPDEYGIPWSFYKNLFKRDVIEENNIRFPDLLRGQDPVFFAEFLSKIDVIYGVPVVLYGYMAPERGKNRINTTIKKRHYMIHYKKTFEILESNGLNSILDAYKLNLINRLDNFNSNNDVEAYTIFTEIFGRKPDILKEYKKDLEFFYISNVFHTLLINDDETYFNSVKKELDDCELWNNNRFSNEELRKIILLYACNSYDDFKGEYLEIEFHAMDKKVKRLYGENKELERKVEDLKKIDYDIHDSNSIKLINLLKFG